ncbi:hypothetical protein BB559_004065 [Furculomyces boomerangus]|uniref:Uncharacterized protein n=1 Tax=Furculomyces boomerangus TaxID=61424 RepID=A0A2T9YGZ4_9FUNG|nr:hypothetical protein BB559_004065 [Furculomyces boomerangus]
MATTLLTLDKNLSIKAHAHDIKVIGSWNLPTRDFILKIISPNKGNSIASANTGTKPNTFRSKKKLASSENLSSKRRRNESPQPTEIRKKQKSQVYKPTNTHLPRLENPQFFGKEKTGLNDVSSTFGGNYQTPSQQTIDLSSD